MTNKRYFTSQTFELLADGLKISRRGILDSSEYEISFEHIHNKKRVQTETNNNLLFLGFFCLVLGFLFSLGSNMEIMIILFVFAAIFLIGALLTRQSTVTILTYSAENICFYYNKRNKQSILNYADEVIAASNAYLYNKYSKVDPAMPIEDQVKNLNFLRDRSVITQEQFDQLKDQLLGRSHKSAVGFGR